MKRLVRPAGPWLNHSTAFLIAVWITHAFLRIAFLFRKDAFGFPIVGKPDWYIFHALFLDLHWIFLWSLPFLILLALASRYAPRVCHLIFGLLMTFHGIVLVCTVIDHETLRFMGTHFDPGFARTYANTASLRPVFHFVAADKSIIGLPYVLLFGCIPCALLLYRLLVRTAWAQSREWRLKPVFWILGGCIVGWLYVYVVWTGGFRMAKLRPFVQSVFVSMADRESPELSADSLNQLSWKYQSFWRTGNGSDSNWIFPRGDYPFYREPVETYCAQPGARLLACNEDDDGDGYPKSQDCFDSDPRVHPGAFDIPGNGIDEDCDGTDAHPWNFVLLILESYRALNVGHLRPYGAVDSATPFLDSLAHSGYFWTRMITSGLPTINALIAIHLSIPQHPTRLISSDFTTLNHRSFTAILGRHGYATHFFSAADPAWDNQTPWLRQWYQGFSYDRSREDDRDMFNHMARWMRDSLRQDRPFFVAAMSKTSHYPFNPVPGVKKLPESASWTERMSATMNYTDASIRTFVDSLRKEPWFDHTVFVILGDHGFPLGEHGSSNIGYGLYTENVWLPLVFAGAHPKLGTSGSRDDLAAHIDLGPTFLDLAGIREANSFMGHSLLSPAPPENQFSVDYNAEQALVEHGAFRWHGAWGSTLREQGEEMFNILLDRGERHNVLEAHLPLRDSLFSLSKSLSRLHIHAVEKNRLWPDSL